MKTVVAGLGIQGRKRMAIAGPDCVATVDPVNPAANFKNIEAVPLESYDSALVCTPDQAKEAVLAYLLSNGKHVLVEKPLLFENSAVIRRLAALAGEKRAACYTAYNHRFEPHIARIKQVLGAGTLGAIYKASFFYGNGTARDVRNSAWRDKGMGVFSDLASHLLDMVLFLFDRRDFNFQPWNMKGFENLAPDHFLCGARGTPFVTLEGTLLSWRNTFHLDIFAEKGSAHIDCLCKWGPSILTLRTRILPSGKPLEERHVLEQPDPTWALEYQHFKALCRRSETNLENDVWINDTLNDMFNQSRELK
jgi:scyllo-inositol 2-dehydrogenase (NADP+)